MMVPHRAAIAGLGTTEAAVAAAKATGASDSKSQLRELTRLYVEAAKIIDPSITDAWVGRPVDGEHAGAVGWIQFDRAKEAS